MKTCRLLLLLCFLSGSQGAPAPFVDIIAGLLNGDVKVVSPVEFFAASANPPEPDYKSPESDSYSAPETTTAAKLFDPSYDPPAPKYEAPAAASSYDLPPPPATYEIPEAPVKYELDAPPPPPQYEAPNVQDSYEAPTIKDSYEAPSPAYTIPEEVPTVSLDRFGVELKDEEWLTSSETGQSYLVSNKNMNWGDARQFCQQNGGFLAELRTADQHLQVNELLGDRKADLNRLWIGLTRPFNQWDLSRDLVTWANWKNRKNIDVNYRCTAVKVKNFRWVAHDCNNNHGYKALCQKFPEGVEANQFEAQTFNENEGSNHCIVKGVLLDVSKWMDKLENIESSADCHNICLKTVGCRFWSWDSSWKRCYLKETDYPVVRDDYSESGTVLSSRGCNQEIRPSTSRQPRVETCGCVPKLFVNEHEHIDPRFLPFNEDDEKHEHLGRLIQHSACPDGRVLVCTDDDDYVPHREGKELEDRTPNITNCLVYDVRLAAHDAMLTLYNVANPESCHAFCLATEQCSYWTWRGDLDNKSCFLFPQETPLYRKVGAAAGTVRSEYSCKKNLIIDSDTREPREIDNDEACSCEISADDDYAGGLDPKYVGGRIVNSPTSVCAQGYVRICRQKVQYSPIPQKQKTSEKIQYSPLPAQGRKPLQNLYQVKEWNSPIYSHIPVESLYARSLSHDVSVEDAEEITEATAVEIDTKSVTEQTRSSDSSRVRFE